MSWPTQCADCSSADLIYWAVPQKGEPIALCRHCRKGNVKLPDVFWDGGDEIGLADGPDGKPLRFSSRGEKARYLEEHGLREAGDTHHGAPISSVESEKRRVEMQRQESRKQVSENLRRVLSMRPEDRHKEFLRITNQRGR